MTELFPHEQVESKSPRLKWMEKHDVWTKHLTAVDPKETPSWCAWIGYTSFKIAYSSAFDGYEEPTSNKKIGFGFTEADAILQLAKNNGWRLWTEESYTPKHPAE